MNRHRRLEPALAAGLVAIATAVVWPGPVGAGSGATCTPPDATFDQSPPDTALRVAAAYRADPGPGFDQIAQRSKGTDANGDPVGGGSSCGDPDPWETLTILLGNKADKARLDNRKPRFSPDYGPIPKSVAVTIEGGTGADVLRGHRGTNVLLGGRANDVIKAAGPGKADSIDCGPGGGDKAFADNKDDVVNCETVVN